MKNLDDAEVGSIRREIYIEATPEVVFDVISQPEHVARWWPDEASYELRPGSTGEIVFGDRAAGKVESFTVLEVDRPRTYSFRWTHPAGEVAAEGNSLLVTLTLEPAGAGTTLTLVETGFRELGWDAALTEALYADHVSGWTHFVPRLETYLASLAGAA